MDHTEHYKPLQGGEAARAPQHAMMGASYPEEMTAPMREELTSHGIEELITQQDVETKLQNSQGTALVLINSVCGCAAGAARPGFIKAILESPVKPDKVFTAFAGVHKEAVQGVRGLIPAPASSPSIAFFKEGKALALMHRSDIEVRDGQGVSDVLQSMMQEFCTA